MKSFRECLLVALLLFCIICINIGASERIEDILKMGQDAYDEEMRRPVELPEQNSAYDFIIVGAGPAGCVLANRLSENPLWTVFLLEAGGTENIVNDMPVLTPNLQLTPANWNYKSTYQKRACLGMNDNMCALPRGKVLGGSSSINFMLHTRGNPEDFDQIDAAGNYEWSYEEVLPYFLRSERANLMGPIDAEYHNTSGLLSIEDVRYRTAIADAFVEGSVHLGYPQIDYNGKTQHGTSYIQATLLNGHRHSAAKAFILPIMEERKNLHVLTFATVTKILINRRKLFANGVNFIHGNKSYTIKSKKEVILSAGAFNSPQLLMLSGIGPRNVLKKAGIDQVVDSPVGKRMYEHMSHFGPTFLTNATAATFFADRVTENDFDRFQLGDPSTPISSPSGLEALTFAKLQNSTFNHNRPDIELLLLSGSLASDYGTAFKEAANFKDEIYTTVYKPLEGIEHFTMVVFPLHPKSIGNLELKDSNPLTPPIIDPNYFADDRDVEIMLAGIKEAIRIAETPAMKKINATLYTQNVPGCEEYEFGTDDYWRCSIKVLSYTLHHQVATCKMGHSRDSTAVVSPELKVHGLKKLRVVDTSVLPKPISGHTNAASFMIGEKAADMIKYEWRYFWDVAW